MNEERRKFLKIVLISGTSFMVGKVLGPLFSKILDGNLVKDNYRVPDKPESDNKTDTSLFRVVENKKMLSVYDATGEEIFQIDKGV